MKARLNIFLLAALFLVFGGGCSKNNGADPLPAYTEIGANSFAFRVNRVAYEPNISWAFPRISVFYNYTDTLFHKNYLFEIEANRVSQQENKHIIILIHYMPKAVTYKLGNYDGSGTVGNYAIYADDQFSAYYGTDSIHAGELTITKLDTVSRVISGKFQFKAVQSCWNRVCNSVINVDGQFDVKYKPNSNIDYY